MSIAALVWAFEQEIKPASTKFVLVAFADCVSDYDGCGFPSIDAICAKTSLDRKTVILALDRLEQIGVISDSGKRVGRTKQVKVYCLVGMNTGQNHYVYRLDMEETGQFYIGVRSCWGIAEDDEYLGSGVWPVSLSQASARSLKKTILAVFESRAAALEHEGNEIRKFSGTHGCMNINNTKRGIVPKQEQFRSYDETVPNSGANSTEIPLKGSQKRNTESSLIQSEPSIEPPVNPLTPLEPVEVPAGLDWEVWERWVDYKKQIRKPIKPVSILAAQRKLAGYGARQAEAVEEAIAHGWQGTHLKDAKPGFISLSERRKEVIDELTGRNRDASCDAIEGVAVRLG